MKAMRFFAQVALAVFFSGALHAGEASNAGLAEVAAAEVTAADAVALNAAAADMSAYLQDTDQRYGEDSVLCVRNWSLYAEYHRQRNFEMAWEPWKYMFESCPLATRNIYLHGAGMVMHFYNNETDPERREAWVDTLMMIYDQRIEYFGEEGYVLGRKAARLYQLRPHSVQELYDLTEQSIELQGMGTEAPVLLINFQSTIRLVEAGLMEPDAIIECFDRATDIIDYNLEHNPQDERFFIPAKNNIRALFEPYATCESLTQVFWPRFEENPDDVELLLRINEMLDNAGCTDAELYYLTTERLHQIQPDAESAFLMGRLENNRENYPEALNYFQEAADLYEEEDAIANQDRIFRAYWLMAEISYRQLHRMPQARGYARQAHEVDPSDGRPLILIGEMYAASAAECGDDEFTRKTAYWPAVDKFLEAARIADEPAVKERARQLADTYRQYFPNNEDIFFHGYNEGESYRVECWINRTTTIRAR